jgi:tripeptide aminopeptidase
VSAREEVARLVRHGYAQAVDRKIEELLARADVAAARAWIEQHDAQTIALQRAIALIPSPTFDEGRRGAFIAEKFLAIGLTEVHTDEVGNVFACHGTGPGPGIVICSHLDTVFPSGTPIDVTTRGDRILAPGIGDNARGLAALLTLAEAMVACKVEMPDVVTFVASVGEEGQGDLRGVKHLFAEWEKAGTYPVAFIALDGPGMDRIVHRALGSVRMRVTFRGPGGHSWAAFGIPNPAHAVGIATARMAEIPLPSAPRAALSVVRIGGGHSLNTIPMAAWLELDLRAESPAILASLHETIGAVLEGVLEWINKRRAPGTAPLVMDVAPLGERPSGTTPEAHVLVQAAVAATRALGGTPALASASTDANVAISQGIPGIAIGAGGKGGDAHLLTEWYENTGGSAGIVRCLLTALAANGEGGMG